MTFNYWEWFTNTSTSKEEAKKENIKKTEVTAKEKEMLYENKETNSLYCNCGGTIKVINIAHEMVKVCKECRKERK